MSSQSLSRLSGISLLIGGLLTAAGAAPDLFIGDDPTNPIAATIAFVRVLGALLLVLGLPGVYSKQAQRAGLLGLIGFVATLLYLLILGVAGDTINAFIVPFVAKAAPALLKGSQPEGLNTFFSIGGLISLVGGVLLGIATMRAAVFQRWVGLLLIIGAVLSFIGSFLLPAISTVGVLLFLLGLAWLGFEACLHPQIAQPQPELSMKAARA